MGKYVDKGGVTHLWEKIEDYVTGKGYLTSHQSLAHTHTLTIGSTQKSVSLNGSQSWSLSEIGAAAASHTHSYLSNEGTAKATAATLTYYSGQPKITTDADDTTQGYAYEGSSAAANLWSFPAQGTYIDSESNTANIQNIRVGFGNSHWHDFFLSPNRESVWHRNVKSSSALNWRKFAFTDDNVASATKLQTARTINGTSFDGTANITTTNWGTARNISISDASGTNTGTAVSVNGSAAATLKLPASVQFTNVTATGTLSVSGAATLSSTLSVAGQLTSTLATGTAPLKVTSTTLNTNLNADLLDGIHATGLLTALSSSTSTNLSLTVGGTTKTITSLAATTAAKLQTARTLTIGNTGKTFDGSGNVSWSLAEIGAQAAFQDVYTDTVDAFSSGVGEYYNVKTGEAISGTADDIGYIFAVNGTSTSGKTSQQYRFYGGKVQVRYTPGTVTTASSNWGAWNDLYSAGTGLALGTNLNGGAVLNHAASITAGTVGTTSATSGYTLAVPYVTYNATGHITAVGTHTHTVNNIPNSSLQNSKVTIGTTAISLGGTATALSGITSLAMTGNLTCSTSGANLTWGNITIYGGGSNGGVNSMLIGDDAYIGDCNVSGCFGVKAKSGTYAGVAFLNSSGSSMGRIVSNNGTLQWVNSSNTPYTVYHSGNLTLSTLGAAASSHNHDSTYLKLSGGTMNAGAQISRAGLSTSWYNGRDGALVRHSSHTSGIYSPILSEKTDAGSWEVGTYNDNALRFVYITDTNYTAKTNTRTVDITMSAAGVLNAPTLSEGGTTLANKYAAKSHTHDDRYYTESEVDAKVKAALQSQYLDGSTYDGTATITLYTNLYQDSDGNDLVLGSADIDV